MSPKIPSMTSSTFDWHDNKHEKANVVKRKKRCQNSRLYIEMKKTTHIWGGDFEKITFRLIAEGCEEEYENGN